MKVFMRILLASVICISFCVLEGCGETEKIEKTDNKIEPVKTETVVIQKNATEAVKPVEPEVKEVKNTQLIKPVETVDASKQPKISLNTTVCDLGTIGPATNNTCYYVIKNEGTGKLIITKVQLTCGCQKYELEKEEIEPGDTSKLTVTYHSATYPGAVNKHLYIFSNDPESPQIEIIIKAVIQLKVEAIPTKIDLKANLDNAGAAGIVLKSIDGKSFAVKSVSSFGSVISFDIDPEKEAVEHKLMPKVDKEKLKNRPDGSISFYLSHPECSQLSVSYTMLKEFTVVKGARSILRDAVPGEKVIKEAWIMSNYDDPMEIESSSSSRNYIRIINQSRENDVLKLELEITPPEQDTKVMRYFNDTMTVKFKSGSSIQLYASGWYARE